MNNKEKPTLETLTLDHWEFIEALLELSENTPLREFLFCEGFKHGYKHGYADALKQYTPAP